MDITNMLYMYPDMEDKISQLRKEIATILDDKYNMRITSSLSNTVVQTSGDGDVMTGMIDSIDRQIAHKQKTIDCLIDAKEKIDGALRDMEYIEQRIVELRYFQQETWNNIARETRTSTRHLYNKCREIKDKIKLKFEQ